MKKNNLLFTIVVIIVSLIGALALTFSLSSDNVFKNVNAELLTNPTFFPQKIESMSKEPHQNYALFDQGNLIGYISSEMVLDELFAQAYEERYQESFPGARVGLGADAYLLSQTSYYYYENIDDKLANYINDNELFAIEATKISFSNGYYCYVSDVETFKEANEQFLLKFISKEDYELLKNNELPPELTSYGTRSVGLAVLENAEITKGFAAPNKVLREVEDIVMYLGYGEAQSVIDYRVEKFDTVPGVSSKTGISVANLLTINPDKLRSVDQALVEGEVLNVAAFQPVINVLIKTESLEREELMPTEPKIIVDPNYPADYREVLTQARPGYQDTKYLTTTINGVDYDYEVLSTNIIESPVNTVIRIGSAMLEDYGGIFIWPTTGRHQISCRWGCYKGHQGIDIQPKGGASYGMPILAAADGVVVSNYFQASYGWHVIIKHVGGYHTCYAHMNAKGPVSSGQTVTRGQVIGNIGSTGTSTAPHLHFEIRVDGKRQNPCLWLGC